MAYQVNRFNGTFFTSVADGTIDLTTNLRFVGKNYAGYGQVQNENFLHLLENFAGASQPSKPVPGQIWFDSTDRKIKVFDGIRFRAVGGATAAVAAPTGLSAGEFWFDEISKQLFCWTGSEYVLIGPENPANLGETSFASQVVKDLTGTNRTIVKIQSGGTVVAIISKDTFELNPTLLTPPLPGFSKIKKGITLVDIIEDSGGNTISALSSQYAFWGTSSASKGLIDSLGNFYNIDNLVKTSAPQFETTVSMPSGFSIGNNSELTCAVSNGSQAIFTNQAADSIFFKIRMSSSDTRQVLEISPTGILPENSTSYSLGSETRKWNQVFSNIFVGNLLGNVIGNTSGTHTGNILASDSSVIINSITKEIIASRFQGDFIGDLNGNATTATNSLTLNDLSPSVNSTPNTVVVRDSSSNITANNFLGTASFADRIKIDNDADENLDINYKPAKTTKRPNTIAARDPAGNLSANIFNGTATAVQGADLAEKYLADMEYSIGTVVTVGGDAEIRATEFGDRAIGVISDQPGLIMNQELTGGTLVALKGRVPVRVIGAIRKGDRLIASSGGCAIHAAFHQHPDVFAIALETDLNIDEKIIEAIVL